ncbi:MAG: trigger factor [Oscillospiraceae bacterium]|jgi:trigger factor|nr:trigger factor [Oscillospiraceae bacterium]
MKFGKKEQKDPNKYALTFEIEAEIFNEYLNTLFVKNAKKLNAPGFRKGKVPRAIVEKIYGANVFFDDAVNDLWPSELDLALKEAQIEEIVAIDKVDVLSVNKQDGVSLCIDVIVKPAVELGPYKGLQVEIQLEEVHEEEIDANLMHLAKRVARLNEIKDAPCVLGDIVNIDFEGFVDNKPLESGKCLKYDLTLGSGEFIKGFENAIVGHKPGDQFQIDIVFPQDYSVVSLAGKAAQFNIQLNGIKRYELPSIDDEFASNVSEFNTLAELKSDILKSLKEMKEKNRIADVEQKLLDKIVEEIKVDVPEIMNERRRENLIANFKQDLERQQRMDLATYLKMLGLDMASFKARFANDARKQVKIKLVLEKIAEMEEIVVLDEDIEKELKRFMQMQGIDLEQAKKRIDIDKLKADLKLKKALAFIVKSAKIKEHSVEKKG